MFDFYTFALETAKAQRDAIIATAPPPVDRKECCADFAYVTTCDGETDTWQCPFCGIEWTAPCR